MTSTDMCGNLLLVGNRVRFWAEGTDGVLGTVTDVRDIDRKEGRPRSVDVLWDGGRTPIAYDGQSLVRVAPNGEQHHG